MVAGNAGRALDFARGVKRVMADEHRRSARRAPLAERTVLYESFAGNGMVCNPEAIFRTALAAPDLQDLRHVWALSATDRHAAARAEFADDPRVSFVRRGSPAYYRVLSRAKYLVNNATFPQPFVKRDGQVYLNTWHGTPVKAMGYDVPGGALETGNVVRNFLAADYLLAPNADTERMYLDAYRLRNLFQGRLIAAGTPRIDRQLATDDGRARGRQVLSGAGIELSADEGVVLYAPTWRGDFYRPSSDLQQLRAVVHALAGRLPAGHGRVLLKVHQRVYRHAARDDELRDMLVPNEVPANDVLAVTDVLITDYSSIFVDFLVTGRPVLFHVPDLDGYAATRGLNLPPERWPGPLSRTLDELVAQLDEAGSQPLGEHYAAARARYCPDEDGAAGRRVVDIVFRNRADAYDVRRDAGDGRTPLLLHLGGLQPNGITAAGLSLVDAVDHDRFDVSVSFALSSGAPQQRAIERLHPRVRLFPQPAGLTADKLRVRALAVLDARTGHRPGVLAGRSRRFMRDEWTRAFGAARFGHVVDFSGYEPYWTSLLAARAGGSLSIWLHNDIAAELANPERAARVRDRLRDVVAFYGSADHLVSVSQRLCELNRAGLARWAPADRFTHARNTVDGRIRALARAEPDADLRPLLDPGTGLDTFITLGRLSAEKNHLRLLQAFAAVHRQNARTRLVVLGDGPLRAQLEDEVRRAGLDGAVVLAGHRPDPYPALARARCFVLSSDYEGQPVALLEALVLGVPVVTTRFDSVRDALPAGWGLVVDRDADALADGMRAFLRGDVPSGPFDVDGYNAAAVAEFYRAIGARPAAGDESDIGRQDA